VKYIYPTSLTYYNLTTRTTAKDQNIISNVTRYPKQPRCNIYFPALHKNILAANKHVSRNSGTLSALPASYLD